MRFLGFRLFDPRKLKDILKLRMVFSEQSNEKILEKEFDNTTIENIEMNYRNA